MHHILTNNLFCNFLIVKDFTIRNVAFVYKGEGVVYLISSYLASHGIYVLILIYICNLSQCCMVKSWWYGASNLLVIFLYSTRTIHVVSSRNKFTVITLPLVSIKTSLILFNIISILSFYIFCFTETFWTILLIMFSKVKF